MKDDDLKKPTSGDIETDAETLERLKEAIRKRDAIPESETYYVANPDKYSGGLGKPINIVKEDTPNEPKDEVPE